MDPSHQRVEQSQVTLPRDDDNEGTESPDVIVGNSMILMNLMTMILRFTVSHRWEVRFG